MTQSRAASPLASTLLAWYDANKRVFSFRDTGDPYRIWISEIMLQQTRTETAEPYFDRFTARFPDIASLAHAELNDVLKAWEGLGYYTRARNLHKAARIIQNEWGGVFPSAYNDIASLPGIGSYTAAAISSIAFDNPEPAMDGNLTRVFSRLYNISDPVDKKETAQKLYHLALESMPGKRNGDYNQALMDLGATLCTPGTPDCESCPLFSFCESRREGHPELLPQKTAAKPPVPVNVTVLLIFCGEKVAVTRRTEGLLKDLYTFLTFEKKEELPEKLLHPYAISLLSSEKAGEAKHVFTHRIWNMTIWLCHANECKEKTGLEWADKAYLLSLPFPTAMRVPLRYALEAFGK